MQLEFSGSIHPLGRKDDSSVSRMHAGILHMLRNSVNHYFALLSHRVELQFFRVFYVLGNSYWIFGRKNSRAIYEIIQLLFVVAHAHGRAGEHIRRADQDRESFFGRKFVRFFHAGEALPVGLVYAQLVEERGEEIAVLGTIY